MKNTKQTLLSIAIIAALPFTANATQTIVETNTPAAVGANGTVKKAAATGPYQTATIGEHDDEHIATTAYVKGAYNDAIAAVNKVDSEKQVKLKSLNVSNGSEQDIEPRVMGSGFNISNYLLGSGTAYPDEYAAMTEDIAYELTGVHDNAAALNDTLISAGTVMQWLSETGDAINNAKIHDSNGGAISPELMSASDFEDAAMRYIVDRDNGGVPSTDETLVSARAIIRTLYSYDDFLQQISIPDAIDSKRVTIYTTWGNDTSAATTQVPFTTAQ